MLYIDIRDTHSGRISHLERARKQILADRSNYNDAGAEYVAAITFDGAQ